MSAPVAILAIGDLPFRKQMRNTLLGLRWRVIEADGGADALAQLESDTSSTVIMDTWFPDLEICEFVREVECSFPRVDLISTDGSFGRSSKPRNNRHGELLYALRVNQNLRRTSSIAPDPSVLDWNHCGSSSSAPNRDKAVPGKIEHNLPTQQEESMALTLIMPSLRDGDHPSRPDPLLSSPVEDSMPEFIGRHPLLIEMCRRIRLVARRNTPVLVQGPSGSGKELIARALHRLSLRSNKPFVAINCSAIPESLLESELFGHTKGSFTGAIQGRAGRIEAATGGTLFLDEIGEMPLSLQAKLLRFLEAGEIQRIGNNELIHVDVRVIAASNRHLGLMARLGSFRADLFYRLAVFIIEAPSLTSHIEDLPELAESFLSKLNSLEKAKAITKEAMAKLTLHPWPGNIRELAHVIERGFILAENTDLITPTEIEFADLPGLT